MKGQSEVPPRDSDAKTGHVEGLPNVVILMARCEHTGQSFGVRMEEKARGRWVADWAFALKETAAKREGYDQTQINGSFAFDAAYPGCPYCEATGLYKCQCEGIACWTGKGQSVTCPWCGANGQVGGPVESLKAGVDR